MSEITSNPRNGRYASEAGGLLFMPRQIQEVYCELGQLLHNPEAFGLDQALPQRLADSLQSWRRMLLQAERELEGSSSDKGCEQTVTGFDSKKLTLC